MWDSVISLLSGPILPRLVLAALLVAFFLFLRKKDTEGEMVGYAILSVLLALRDLAFAFVSSAFLANATDILLACGILYLVMRPFRLGWAFWLPLCVDALALILLVLDEIGLSFGLAPELLRLAGLLPVLALAFLPLVLKSEADTSARQLSLRSWALLSIGLAFYLVVGNLAGTKSQLFLIASSPYLYCLLFVIALLFIDIVQGELVSAVDYYEESVDSLYDLLLATGGSMRSESFLQDVVDNMIRAVVERTGADGGILLLVDEFEDTVSVRALYGSFPPPFKLPENLPKDAERVEAYIRHARFKLGEGVFGEVARTGKNIFVSSPDALLPDNGGESWLAVGAFMVSPLILRDRIIGAVSVVKVGNGRFSERDFDRCKLLANFGSIAVANSFSFLEAAERSDIERESDIAAVMQKQLLPEELPAVAGLEFGAFSNPAPGVCSDYYDVIRTRPEKALIVVGEAAGKGVAAGTVLVMIRAILHLIIASTKDVATLMQWVNRGVSGKVDSDHFATLCLASVDARTGIAEVSCAGRQSAVVCRAATGELTAVEAASVPIGIEKGTAYASSRIDLAEGDVLVLFSDGTVETMNAQGKQYGRKRLGAEIQACRNLHAQEMVERIRLDIEDFAGASLPRDDRTLLVMKRSKQ
jgi:sigma-B regulation protein RsbU (phosphoserine phosphatase)